MRVFPIVAVSCMVLASCGQHTLTSYTRADFATLRLRDLNPLAKAPPIVEVQQATLQEIAGDRRSLLGRSFAWFRKSVDYAHPALPDGSVPYDGSLLPPKTPGERAVLNDVSGLLPDPHIASYEQDPGKEEGFSIE